jgi:short-subunit dehydrogenase
VRDRVVLVTGASSGIGAATAAKIGAARGEVVLVARGRERLEETADQVEIAGGRAHVYPCDLSDLDAIEDMADPRRGRPRARRHPGQQRRALDPPVARAVLRPHARLPAHDAAELLRAGRAHAQAAARDAGAQFGHVVNVSSIGVQTRVPRFGAYIASKAALDTLCDAWQAETHSDNVRFTTVHMALVRTPMIEATTIYDRFPVLSTGRRRGRAVRGDQSPSPPREPAVRQIAAFADAMSPRIMDRVRNQGFQLFRDSAAARGQKAARDEAEVSAQARVFAEVTRGVHW